MGRQRGLQVVQVALLIVGLSVQAPIVWAQPIEVDRSVTTEVASSIERLVAETAVHDPELASLIEREGQTCLLDLDDGVLEDPQLTEAVEAVVIANEAREQVVANVAAEQLASEVSKVDPQLAAQLGAPELGGGPSGETIHRDQAKQIFEKAYSEAVTRDPEGAQRMKEMFDAFEKGEFHEIVRPTPEMMERMQGEMERYFADRGQGDNEYVRECAIREMERLGGEAREQFEREMGGEHSSEFERLMAEGHSPEEIAKMMEHEMSREWEAHAREWETHAAEFERYFEGHERYFEYQAPERNYDNIQEIHAEMTVQSGGGGSSHVLKEMHTVEMHGHAEGHWDGDGDGIADHTHSPETTPH